MQDAGEATASTASTFMVNGLTLGAYDYCVIVTNTENCVSEPGCTTVLVNAEEEPPVTLPYDLCQGEVAPADEGLVAACVGDVVPQWFNNPGGTQIGSGSPFLPSGYTNLATGTYTYFVTCGEGSLCSSGFGSAVLTINPQPDAPVVPDATVCEGVSINICLSIFNDPEVMDVMVSPPNSSSEGSMLALDASGCFSIDPSDPGYVSGDYTVTYTDLNGCESLPGSGTITINPSPADPAVNTECVCEGDDAVLTIGNPVAGGSYSWSGPNGGNTYMTNGTSATIPGVIFSNDGDIYDVVLTDGSGCTSMSSGAICVRALPTVTATTNDTICEGDTPTTGLTATCSDASSTILWYDSFSGGNQIGAGSPFIPAGSSNLSGGTYTYYAECSIGSCASPRMAATLTVTPAPAAPTVPNITVCDGVEVVICPSVFNDPGVEMGIIFPPNSMSESSALPIVEGCATISPGTADYVSGTYSVQYVQNGCTSLVGQGEIIINPLPNDPVVKTACVCDGEDVQFTISNPLQGGSYAWSGPNGYTSNNPAPIISGLTIADHNTTYDVIVTDGNGCSAMGQGTVCILPAPIAPDVTPYEICEGSLVGNAMTDGLGATCGTGETLLWYDSFNGGNQIGTGTPFMPPGYSNLSAGTYTYYAECSVGGCISERSPVVLTIIEGAPAPVVPDVTVCNGESIEICISIFTDMGVSMGMVFPPNSNSQNSMLTPDSNGCVTINSGEDAYVEGTYTAQYVDANGCTSVAGEGQITIVNLSSISVETVCVCEGEDSPFTVSNAPSGGSYAWTGPDGFTSSSPSITIPNVTLSDNGDTYSVVVSDPNGCTTMGAGMVCVVATAPTPMVEDYEVCSGTTVSGEGLTAICPGGETPIWYANFSGGEPIGSGSPFLPSGYNNFPPGSYTYYAACASGDCAGGRSAATLTIGQGAPAPVVPDIAVCNGETISFCLSLVDDGILPGNIFVSPPNSNSMESMLDVDGAGCVNIEKGDDGYVEGTYTVVYVDANGCTSAPGEGNITINPLPLDPIIETACVCDGEDVQITITNPLAGGSYSWTGPNSYTSNNPNPLISGLTAADDDGTTYSVIVTDANGCTSMGETTVCILPAPDVPDVTAYEICGGSLASDGEGLMAACASGETTLWYDSVSGGSAIGTGSPFLPTGYNNFTAGTYTYYAECTVGGCTSDSRSPVVLTITEGAPAPVLPDVAVCEGDTVNFCLSLVDDGILPGNIFVSPPNSNSMESMLDVDAMGCVDIAPGDEGYVSGTYTVVYVDANGCTSAPGEGQITINPLPEAPVVETECVCDGEDAQLMVLNEEANSSYAWNDPTGAFYSNNPNATVPAGTAMNGDVYTVVVTDSNGCISTNEVALCVLPSPVPPTMTAYEICSGSIVGDASEDGLLAECADAGETILWYDSVSGGSAIGTGSPFLPTGYNNLTPGTYTYYAECSVGGCVSDGRSPVVLTITEGAPAPVVPDVAVCEGEPVEICLSLIDAIPASNIFVSPPNSSSPSSQIPVGADGCAVIASGAEGYVSGTYTVVYVDANGCTSAPGEGEVTINPLPNPPVVETACVCEGEDAQLTIINEDASSTYVWTDPMGVFFSNNPNPSIPAGTAMDGDVYMVTVTDSNGCTVTGDATICVLPAPIAPDVTPYEICEGSLAGDDAGLIASCAAGETTLWYDSVRGGSPIGTGSPFLPTGYNNLTVGTYTYYAECSVGGCIGERSPVVLTITEGAPAPVVPNPTVCDGEEVEICLSLSADGIADSNIFISPPNSNSMESMLDVVDGCAIIAPGDEGYVSGTYTVVYVDANGCTSLPGEGEVTINPLPNPPVVETACVCEGEAAQLTIINEDASSTYVWTDATGAFFSNNPNPAIPAGTAMDGDVYTVVVTDANGCTAMGDATVCILPSPTAPGVTPYEICEGSLAGDDAGLMASCADGETTLWYDSVSGGSPIGTGSPFLPTGYNNLTIGTYTYYAECSVGGCIGERSPVVLTITEGAPAPVVPDVAVCAGDTVEICLSLSADDISDSNIFISPPNSNSVSSMLEVIDGCATILPDDEGYVSGNYVVTYVDANGCTSQPGEGTVTIYDLPNPPVAEECTPVCEGETAQIILTNEIAGATYTWTTPAGEFFSNNPNPSIPAATTADAGVYTVVVTDTNGCMATGEGEICITEELVITATAEFSCEQGDISLVVTGAPAGSTYAWNGPNGFSSAAANPIVIGATVADNGTYTVVVTSPAGCTGEGEVVVDVNSSPAPVVPDVEACNGQPVEICLSLSTDGIPDSDIFISPPNSNSQSSMLDVVDGCATILPDNEGYVSGTYTVVYIDANGCTSQPGEATVTIHDLPNDPVIETDCVCEGEDAQFVIVNADPSSTYNWYDPSGDFFSNNSEPVITAGTAENGDVYTLIITDPNGCTVEGDATVCISPAPVVEASVDYNLAGDCTPSDVFLSAEATGGTPDYTYAWTGPNGFTSTLAMPEIANASTADNGSYVVVITDNNGCTATDEIQVLLVEDSQPDPVITSSGPVCEGGEVILSIDQYVGPNVSYTWTFSGGAIPNSAGSNTNILILDPADVTNNGTYTVTVSILPSIGSEPCVLTATYDLEIFSVPAPPVVEAYSICEGNIVSDASTSGLLATCVDGTEVVWYDAFNGGNQIGTGSPFMPAGYNDFAAGTYTYYASCGNASCEGERTPVTLVITDGAPAPIVPSPTICDGNVVEICLSLVDDDIDPANIFVSPPNSNSVSSMLEVGADGCITITPEDDAYVSGTYTVTYIDANGCESQEGSGEITITPLPPEPVITSTGPVCEGECVTLSTKVQYEGSDINYVWFTPNGTMVNITGENSSMLEICPTIASEHDGDYSIGVTVDGCSIFSDNYYLDIFESPEANPQVVYDLNPDCSFSNISLTANATGGTAPYTYDWTGPNGFVSTLANPGIANAGAANNGTYTVVITDFNGCMTEGAVEVLEAENPQALPVIASSGPACEGECIILSVPVYEGSSVDYVWFTPNGTPVNITGENTNEISICPVEAAAHEGIYTVGVTVDGCSLLSDEYTLDVFEQPIVEVEADLACIGSDITLTTTVTNAADLSGPLTYEWTGPNGFTSDAASPTIANATAADAGTYTVMVSALTGCTATASIDIDVYDAPPAAQIEGPSIVCAGDEFTLCTSTAGDYPDAVFTYSPPNSSSTASQITAVDGCITVSSESPAYVSGAWTVTYTDGEGCASEPGIPHEVLIQAAPTATADNNGPICFGEDVQLFAGIVDGATYAWYVSGASEPFTTEQNPVITDVIANTTYVVEVTVNGCTSTAETEVILEGPIVEVSENTPVCTGATVVLTATVTNAADFNGLITYDWTGPNGFFSNAQNPTIANAQLLDAGTYTVVVTTTGECQGVASVEVEVYNVLPAATIDGPAVVCEGNPFTLCTSSFADYPGGSFSFSPPNSSSVSSAIPAGANGCITVTPEDPAYVGGDWTVSYTDAEGCSSAEGIPFELLIQDLPIATAENNGPICFGEDVELTSGYVEGAVYAWYVSGDAAPFSTDQNTTVTNVTENTTYTVAVSVNGCVSTADTYVILEGPVVTATENTPICVGGDIELTATVDNEGDFNGFITYEWSGPNGYTSTAQNPVIPNATLADAGTYTVLVTTSGTCKGQSTVEVEVYNTLPAATIEGEEYVCEGESFTLCTSSFFDYPGGTFLFSPPNSSSVSSAIAADANGCITVNPLSSAYVSGDWTVEYTDANGCASEQGVPFAVTIQPLPVATADNDGPICYGDNVALTAGYVEGATYEWYAEGNPIPFSTDHNTTVTDLTAKTTYEVHLTVNGCTSIALTTVILEGPIVEATDNTPVCTGEDIVLTAEILNAGDFTGFVSYEWTGPNGYTSTAQNPVIANATLADAGTYTVIVTTSGTCQGQATTEVEVYEVLPAATIEGPEYVCLAGDLLAAESFTLCTSSYFDHPGGTFLFSPPNSSSVSSAIPADANGCITVTPDDPAYVSGDWTVTYANANGCESEQGIPFTVTLQERPQATAQNSGPICYGDDVQLFAGPVDGATYAWYSQNNPFTPFSTEQNPVITYLTEETTFVVDVTVNGCTSSSFTTVILEGPEVIATENTPVCTGEDIVLTAEIANIEDFTGFISYEWTGPNGFTSDAQNPVIANASLADAGTYTVLVNTTGECQGTATVEVEVYDVLPAAAIDGPEIVCEGESFTLCTSSFEDYPGGSFTISPPNSTSVSSALAVDAEGCVTINSGDEAYISGAFTVLYTNANGCESEEGVPFVVNINPIPEATAWNSGPICFGEPVQLFAGDVPGATYEWYTGDDLVSTDQNPYVFDLSAETTYTVYTTLDGCTSEGASTTVTFDGPQVTVFAPTPICIGSDIPLTGNVLNAGSFNGELTYSWTGPNGFTSNAQNPVVSNVTLAASGTYTLVVTTTSGCPGTASVNVDVYEALPSASIDGPEIVCEGEPFTLCTSNYHDYADATFTISPPNSTSTSSALEVDENGCVTINPGDFAYVSGGFTVSYTSADGCIAEEGIAHQVSINAMPVVSADNNGAICAGDDVQLIAGDLVGASYEWYSGGVLVSTEQNPVIYGLDVTTTYEVIATVEGCASGAAITTVTVHPLPAIVSILGGDTYCEGTDVTLASIVQNAGPGSVHTWIGPNGFEYSALVGGNLTLPNVTEADAGVYTLTVTSAEGCVSEPYSVTVDVVGQTQPEIVSSDSGCEGGEITMSITAYEGLDVIYTWTTPNGETENISGLNTHEIMIDPASADLHNGEYTVSVTVNGCVLTSLPYNLDINESPEAAPEATYNLNADCSFSNITLEANASGGTAPYTYEWTGPNGFTSTLANPGITNATTDNNGTYTVTVTDANGCSVTVGEEVLDIADPVDQPVITASDTGCEGDEVVLSVTTYGGSDVNYVWTLPSMENVSGANTSTITIDPSSADLHDGAYSVAVTVDGCVLVSDVYDLVINPSPEVISILGGDVYCEGSDVTLTATIEGATAGSTYTWTGPNGLSHSGTVGTTTVPLEIPAITPEDAGTYTLTISNENGCSSAPYSTTIDVVPQTAPVIVSNDSGCEGGAITLSVPAYEGVSVTYSWTTPNGTTVDISGLNTHEIMIDPATAALHNGDYTVTITVDGCSLTSAAYNLDINESPEATPEATYNLNADCSFSNITLEANASSGTAPYTYEWTGPNGFTSTLANPGIANATTDNNGTYTVVVTDANGCSVTAGVEVLDIADPVDQPVITASETGCEGDEVILSVTTYSGSDVDYVWTVPSDVNVSGINTSILTIDPSSAALHNGEYIVEVTVDGCVLTSDAYNLVINPSPEVISILGGDVYCEGRDVTLTAIVEGATPGSTYEWTGPNGLNHSGALGTAGTIPLAIAAITPEDAGTYTLVVTNENGCSSAPYSTTIDVIPQTAPVITSTDTGCEGGEVTLSIPAYEGVSVIYSWTTPNGTTQDISGLSSNAITIDPTDAGVHNGTYTVTVSVNGCELSANYELDINDSPSAAPTANYSLNADCSFSNVTLEANASNGTAPYTYEWTGPNGFTSSLANPGIANATTDNNGTYTVTVTDANGCSFTTGVEVLNIEDPEAQPVISASGIGCEGDIVVLSVGIYEGSSVTYTWTTPSGTTVDMSGMNTNELTINPVSSTIHGGTYSVTVNIDGCELVSAPFNLDVNPAPIVIPEASYSLNADCSGADLLLTANATSIPPLTYDWSGPNGFTSDAENPVIVNATSAANGVYTVIVTDASGCSTEASTNVIDNISDTVAEPVITASENTCEGGEVILSIASYEGSSVTYTWSTPNGVTVGISGLNTPSISISPVSAALHSGAYSVTIEIDGCTLTSDPYNLEINAAPIVSPEASYSLNADCASADLLLTANATGVQPLTYDWTGPNGFTSNAENPVIVNATAADNGVYTVVVTDAEGCTTEASTNVITDIQDPISQPVIAATDTGCEGGEVTLSITAYEGSSVSYTWSTPSGTTVNISGLNTNAITIDPADAAIHNGPYTVTVNVDGCELTSDVFNLDINPAPAPTDLTGGGTYCEGDDVLLSAANLTAGMEYTWSGPNGFTYSGITTDATMPTVFLPSVDESDAGVYTLSLVSAQGCISAPASLIIEVVGQPDTPELVANDVALCEGDILELSVTSPVSGTDVTYEWYYNAGAMGEPFAVTTTPNVLVTDAATVADGGAYTVVVVSGETGCASAPSNFIMVEVEAIPDLPSSVIDLTICEGESIPAGTGISAVCSDEQTTVERVSLVSDVDVPIGFGDSEAYGDGSMPYPGPNYAPPVVPSIPAGAVITNVTLDIVLTTFGNSCESDIVLEVIDPTGVATEFRPFTTCNGTAANNYTATINYAPNTVVSTSTVGSWTVNLKDTDDQNVGADEFWARYGALTYEYEVSGSASGNLTWWDAEIGGDMLGQGSVYTPDTENMSAGVHTFWAQCGDACPSDRVPVTVTVVAAPPAPAIGHNSPVCLGEAVTLCISADLGDVSGATSIDYTFIPPSGSTSEQSTTTDADGCIEVTEAGEWTAYYTVTYGDGMTCSSEVSAPVDVSFTALEEPVITSSGPSCEGGTIVLTIPTYSGNMTGYAWFYDGSTLAGNLPNVTGENSNKLVISPVDASTHEGGYSVAVTVDGCTVQSDVYNLDVYDAANLAPSYELENNCEGGDLYLFANVEGAGSGAAYSWTGPNGFTSNAENPVLANADVNSNGTYTVTVTTASGCSATASVNVVVITDAPATPSIAAASAEVCEGEDIVLSVPQSYPAGTVYTWIDGTGATIDSGTSSTITVASSTAQPFSVYVTVGDCTSEVSDLAYVTVHETPIASATNNGPLCIGDDAQLIGGPIPAGGTYNWTDENGNLVSTAQNPVIYNIQSTSTYELVVTVNGCSSAVATTTIEIETVGEPLNPADYVICEGDNIPQGQGLFAECFSGDLVTTFDTIQLVSDEDIFIGTMDTESYADNPPLIFADPGVPVGTQITGVQLRLFFRIEGASCESDIDIRVTDPLGNVTEFISPITGCVGNSGGLYNFTTMLSPTGLAGLNSGNWIVELKDSNDQNAIAAGSPGNSAPAGTEYSVRFGDIQYMTELATGTSTNISWWDASVGGNMLGIDAPLSPANAEDYAPGVYTFWAECGFNCVSETRVPVRLVVNAAPDTPNLVVDASCAGGSLVLRTDVVCDSYQWIGPDGNGPITNVFEATIGANSSFYDEGMWYVICEDVQGCTSESAPVEVNFEELSAPVVTNTTAGGQVCEGDAVQFFTQTPGSAYTTGGTISYTWFFNGTPWLVNGNPVTTQNPVIPAASLNNNGVYTVVASIGGCNSSPSAPTVVNVTPMPAQPVATASTPICEGEPLQLSTTFIPGATYTWFGPAGFTSNLANPIIPVATLSNAGEYYVYVTLNGCSSELSEAVIVVVNNIPAAPMAINDGPACEGGDVNLMVGDPVPGVTYTWYSATTNTVVGVGATVTLPNVGMGDSGMYYVMADVVGCTSAFAETLLTVDESQTGNQADAGLDMAVCGDVASISATVPSNGAGMWTSPTGATIANPDAGTTTVSDLIVGENVFIWTLNNGACGGIDSDEMIIVVADEVIATDDVTAIDRGDQLMSYDVLDNDDIGGLYGADYTITVMEELTGGDGMGSLTNNGDGTFNYIPTPGFYGTVEFTYMVCSTVCEDVCSEARVVIDVMAPLACEIPNVFTPNGDGMNDNFEIPCLGNNEYATNKLVVFNRWGDQVYEQRGYTNSWSGTYNGKDLPEGTYYYVLKLNDTLEPLQGFIMIQR